MVSDMAAVENRSVAGRPRATIGVVAAAGPVLYAAGWCAASLIDGQPLARVACFDAGAPGHFAPLRLFAAVVMALGAVLTLFVVPWLLGTLALRCAGTKRAMAGAWSLAGNTAALMTLMLALCNTVGVDRLAFLGVWVAWTTVLVWVAGRSGDAPAELGALWRRWGGGMMIGVVAVAAAVILFRRECFVQCFDGDGTELFDLARSLRGHFLPYWEIEVAERFGTVIVNPSLINSYWTCGLQMLLGENELATRLPYWVWWLGIFGAMLTMVQPAGGKTGWRAGDPAGAVHFSGGRLVYVLCRLLPLHGRSGQSGRDRRLVHAVAAAGPRLLT